MDIFEGIPPYLAPAFLVGLALLALAGWVTYLEPRKRLHRALALVLLLNGLYVGFFPLLASTTVRGGYAQDVRTYLQIAVPFAAINFALLYRNWMLERAGRPTLRGLRAWRFGLLVGALTLEVLFAWDHTFYDTETGWGPFRLFDPLQVLALALIGLLLAHDIPTAVNERARNALVIASVGFAAFPAARAMRYLWDNIPALGAGSRPFQAWATFVVFVFTLAVTLESARRWGIPGARAKDGPTPWVRNRAWLVLGAVFAAEAIVWGLYEWLDFASKPAWVLTLVRTYAYGLPQAWTLFLAAAVTYSLLRFRLFDLDLTVRWAVVRSLLAGSFLAVFFVGTQIAQNRLSQDYGWAWGGIAAGLLLFALAPLQRVAERVTGVALPGTQRLGDLSQTERLTIYREQAAIAWLDGSLARRERLLLNQLRERLGLDAAIAERIEEDVAGAGPSAPTLRRPGPKPAAQARPHAP